MDLLHKSLGTDYGSKEIHDPAWCAAQVTGTPDQQTWVAEAGGRLQAALTILLPAPGNTNPILYLGRHLFPPESFPTRAAEELLRKMLALADAEGQIVVARVSAFDFASQGLHENLGFICAGFQPFKHSLPRRTGMLFYVRPAAAAMSRRQPLAESSVPVGEIAVKVLERFKLRDPLQVRESIVGYPLQSEVDIAEGSFMDYEARCLETLAANTPPEVSSGYNVGLGHLHIPAPAEPFKAFIASRAGQPVAGLSYFHDPLDRCIRFVGAFAVDDLSLGALLQNAVKLTQEQSGPVYLEIDVLAAATRLLKTLEQLGFVPVAYLPAFFLSGESRVDVVKMVKLNVAYSHDGGEFTPHARGIVEIVDAMFNDQKTGVAIINLLRALPIFSGLGDGELRKIARLFTQKLYRAGERIFNRGDVGEEAYIVMRGQIDIRLQESSPPIATVTNGKIFGELAILDGAPRNALAIVAQPSILLVVKRAALNDLIQREPHLGMIVMRNIAIDLSNKLRQTNIAISAQKK